MNTNNVECLENLISGNKNMNILILQNCSHASHNLRERYQGKDSQDRANDEKCTNENKKSDTIKNTVRWNVKLSYQRKK